MITFAFDSSGKSMYSLNKVVQPEDLPDAAYVVHMPVDTDVNSVWYDVENSRVGFKTAIQPTITTNTVSGLPAGTTVALGADLVEVADGEIVFEVIYPQTLQVILFHPRYADTVIEVPCEAQG
jgi:hypothetical protein